jgi:hypothetical protein
MSEVLRHAALAVAAAVTSMSDARGVEPSLLQLLADPARYHGQRVLVVGYCRLEVEGAAIYLHKEDYVRGLGNKLRLDIPMSEITPQKKRIKYCLVEGTLNAKEKGPVGGFAAAIQSITRYEHWPPYPPRRL